MITTLAALGVIFNVISWIGLIYAIRHERKKPKQ